ncbi:MAG: hypothetical protein HRT89_23830, partial [Lentisphaeria bacterium]|nr:hypothetical protein [Lentisphaeria bacterium]
MSAEAENIEHNVHSQDDEHEHQDHAHYHAKMKPFALVFGGALILASFLAEAFYDEPALAILSARLGSVLLSIPIVIDAAKHIAKGKIHMDSLVGIALIAAIVMQKYQEAGIIAFFMLIAIALEERTAHGAQKSIKGIISLTPNIARLLKGNDEIDVKLSE